MSEIKKHVVITGTGRAGTTFLVELLTKLGLDTGFDPDNVSNLKNPVAHAGLESRVGDLSSPYIVKDPSFCEYAEEVLSKSNIQIDHVYIPMRDIQSVAESRRENEKKQWRMLSWRSKYDFIRKPYLFYGGLLGTRSSKKGVQESILVQRLHDLLLLLSQYQIPVTLIHFPKSVNDASYLYDKLKVILGEINFQDFQETFNFTAKKELVNQYYIHK